MSYTRIIRLPFFWGRLPFKTRASHWRLVHHISTRICIVSIVVVGCGCGGGAAGGGVEGSDPRGVVVRLAGGRKFDECDWIARLAFPSQERQRRLEAAECCCDRSAWLPAASTQRMAWGGADRSVVVLRRERLCAIVHLVVVVLVALVDVVYVVELEIRGERRGRRGAGGHVGGGQRAFLVLRREVGTEAPRRVGRRDPHRGGRVPLDERRRDRHEANSVLLSTWAPRVHTAVHIALVHTDCRHARSVRTSSSPSARRHHDAGPAAAPVAPGAAIAPHTPHHVLRVTIENLCGGHVSKARLFRVLRRRDPQQHAPRATLAAMLVHLFAQMRKLRVREFGPFSNEIWV